ncbi:MULTISPECIES: sugar kinase [unclassified Sinorhizobium]|uniref:sugar kinase n=1 Tax=unclassified Sinorhizobium TaxID=2613772 RepID=UPI0024C2B5E8|nr:MULTISPECIES: sugar kinase [unclassified Sinorhizobium]MDK1377944.1 sugar kinase [Sinorhizobium sp. 6-70]MDK1482485.1 sugar kinase [Sinorhizobium sp. 6-117]
MPKTFLSIGECMIELSQAGDGHLKKGFAGDSFNTAWYARAFLGDDWRVSYFTALGTDRLSDEMLAFMSGAGIASDHVRRIEGRNPGMYMIHLKNGERSFQYWRETSAAKLLAEDGERLRAAIDDAELIYFSGITLAILSPDDRARLLDEIRRARELGKTVAFDPNLRPRLWQDTETMCAAVSDGARVATMVFPSFDDERSYFGDADRQATVKRYRDLGAGLVVVKDGANGITIGDAGSRIDVPAHPADPVRDTTSAGDSFNGAFLAMHLRGQPSRDAAAFAAKVAARVIEQPGALIGPEHLPQPEIA